MADVLKSKRAATRFRILAEIADRQPAVSQGEIAEAVGITSQAVSEYMQQLESEGLVEKEGRSRYRVTTEGVDWLLNEATEAQELLERVTEDILGGVKEDAAVATAEIEKDQTVSLHIDDGVLRAEPNEEGNATGIATTNAAEGEDVGVTNFDGIIDLEPGRITILQIPTIRSGGSRSVDSELIKVRCADVDLIAAAGVEAIVTLEKLGIKIDTKFGVGNVAADAARRGLDVVIAATADTIGRVTDPLRDHSLAYEVEDVGELSENS